MYILKIRWDIMVYVYYIYITNSIRITLQKSSVAGWEIPNPNGGCWENG